MRTAITTALTHDGKDILLFGKSVPILKQKEAFKKMKILPTGHELYASAAYQESDGAENVIRFRSPSAQKTHDELRAKEQAAADKAGEKEKNKQSTNNNSTNKQ